MAPSKSVSGTLGAIYESDGSNPVDSPQCGVPSHGQKMSQMTQFYILTHFDVFCVGAGKTVLFFQNETFVSCHEL